MANKLDDMEAAKMDLATSPDVSAGEREKAAKESASVSASESGSQALQPQALPLETSEDRERDERGGRIASKALAAVHKQTTNEALDSDVKDAFQEAFTMIFNFIRITGAPRWVYGGLMFLICGALMAPFAVNAYQAYTNTDKEEK